MIHLLFISGWGFDRSVWAPICSYLPPHIQYDFIDFGFLKEKQSLKFPVNMDKTIIVAHSLGGLYAMKSIEEINRHPKGFIYFNGFTNFQNCTSPKVLNAMITQLIKNPGRVFKSVLYELRLWRYAHML